MANKREIVKLIHEKYDAMIATQIKLIAEERGVSVEELCFCYDLSVVHQNMNDGHYRFWVEVR